MIAQQTYELHTPEYVGLYRKSKGELSILLYPDEYYSIDTALPQSWVDNASERGMDDAARHVVTVYPRHTAVEAGLVANQVPFIAPVTTRGLEILCRLASSIQ